MDTDFLLRVGERIVPGLNRLDNQRRQRVRAIIEYAVAARPPAVQRQLAAFLKLLRWAPVARYAKSFDKLDPAQQDAVLRWIQDAPVTALRSGFWGLKTLVYLGYYGRDDAGDEIGYRPSRSGNDFLHAP